MSGVQATEAMAAAIATAPRVALADIQSGIRHRIDALASDLPHEAREETERSLKTLSLCVCVMRNGFIVIGKSAPASPDNFDADLGRQLAYEDAIRQLWPLMGYALRDRLADTRPQE